MTTDTNPSQPDQNDGPIDLVQLRAAQAERAATPEAAAEADMTRELRINHRSWPLVTFLTPLNYAELQQAEESGSILELMKAVPLVVPKQYRQEVEDYILGDPEDEADRVDFYGALLPEWKRVQEVIAARPTSR